MAFLFTSDPHFGHNNIIKYCNRPFKNAEEMDEKLIADWNKFVGGNDTVYVLGDFTMSRVASILEVLELVKKLNGKIHLVPGNHDDMRLWNAIAAIIPHKVVVEPPHVELNIQGQAITLCHYSHQVWNKSHHGAWMLFGHSHNTLPGVGKSMDVGVDAKYAQHYNWAPFTLDEIKAHMMNKPIFGEATD